MRIIQVVGSADTGKTTFIVDLIRELKTKGSVAVVKPRDRDSSEIEKEKNTALYAEAGAERSVAIDGKNAATISSTPELAGVLTELCDAGTEYCIIEGFETVLFPGVIIGDLETDGVVLRNPATAREVIEHLGRFEEFQTMQGVVRELRRSCPGERAGCVLSFNGLVREITGSELTDYMDFSPAIEPLIKKLEAEARETPGVIGARFHHRKGRLYAGEDITYFAILAEHRQEAFAAMSRAIDRLKSEVHNNH
ncbi:MAG: molybdopterin synthase catalytic subunit [Methanofollis sp.]|nr:molybdopterin synthase catalytic subunit [Methanofollis sp.]